MTKLVVVGPFGEGNLRDEARLDPLRIAYARRVARDGRGNRILRQLIPQPDAQLRRKPRPYFSCVMKLAVIADICEVQRADLSSRRRAQVVSDDRELLLVERFDLQPLFRPASFVYGRVVFS